MKLERAVGKNKKLESFKLESLKLESFAKVGKSQAKTFQLLVLSNCSFQLHASRSYIKIIRSATWRQYCNYIENHTKVTNEVTIDPDPELENLMNRVIPLLNDSKR